MERDMGFTLREITDMIIMVILRPKEFWNKQKIEGVSRERLLVNYFFPLVLLVAAGVFTGELISSNSLYAGFALLKAVREIILFVLIYYLAFFLTRELIKILIGEKNRQIARKLVLFSLTPMLLVSFITGLFQFLYILDILSLYSFYIFWIGINELLFIKEQKQKIYIFSVIIMYFILFSLLSIILSKLLTAYY